MSRYNDRVKNEYRTLLVAFFNAVEVTFDDRELSARRLLEVVRLKGLSQRESLSANWLRARVYQPDKYAILPFWLAKAAYFCLLDVDGWVPQKDSEWFVMVALFVGEEGGKHPSYSDLVDHLPDCLKGEVGEYWLSKCVQEIHEIQKSRDI